MLGGGQNNTYRATTGSAGGSTNRVNQYAAIAGGEYNQAIGEGTYIGGGGYTPHRRGAIVAAASTAQRWNFATVPEATRTLRRDV